MFKKLSVKLGVWSLAAILAAFVTDLALNFLRWENTRAAELEAAVMVCLMAYLYFLARKLVFRPMRDIEETAERIKAGDLAARTNITSSRELSVLSETLNSMVEKLAESNRQLQEYSETLEKTVEERTTDLNRERELRIALLTHDLKSPLTSILGYSELLLSGRKPLDADQEDCVRGIISGGERLLGMTEQYLELTKMEAGLTVLDIRPLDPEALVRGVVSELEIQAREKGIALSCETGADVPTVQADREKIERAITNLVINAIKYTPANGSVEVKSSYSTGDAGEAVWEVSVSDNGYGIPAEDLNNIFKTYYRSSSSAGTRGTGLGLAVVKSFVEAHGGSVEVESSPGAGSTFTIRIPITKDEIKGAAA